MFFLRMCTYLYLYLYLYRYLYLYDDMKHILDQRVIPLYILAVGLQEIAQDVVRCAKELDKWLLRKRGRPGWPGSIWIHLVPSSIWGWKLGNHGKSMGNQWEITLEVSKMIRRTMKSHSHYSLGRSPMEKSPTVAGSEFLGSEVRCLPARGSGVAMASHGGSWIGTRRGGVSGRILGAQAEGDEPLGPLTLRTWIRFIWLWINTY